MAWIAAFLRSLRFAGHGIAHAARTQRNVRIQLAAAAGVAALAAWLRLPARDWAVLALTVGGVLSAELVNTALESAVDLASPERRELARIAKDCAAAAVLCLAIASVAVGACLLGPPLLERLLGAE